MPSWKKIVNMKQAERAARLKTIMKTPAVAGEISDFNGKVLPPAHELIQANGESKLALSKDSEDVLNELPPRAFSRSDRATHKER